MDSSRHSKKVQYAGIIMHDFPDEYSTCLDNLVREKELVIISDTLNSTADKPVFADRISNLKTGNFSEFINHNDNIRVQILTGINGIGKSVLAMQYAVLQADKSKSNEFNIQQKIYDNIIWVSKSELIYDEIKEIISVSKKILIIFDDFSRSEEFTDYLDCFEKHQIIDIIVTSCSPYWDLPKLWISSWRLDEAETFVLEKLTSKQTSLKPLEAEMRISVVRFCQKFDYYPLAIATAMEQISSIEELQEYIDDKSKMISFYSEFYQAAEKFSRNVCNSAVNNSHLNELAEISSDEPDVFSQKLLFFLVALAKQPVPYKLLEAWTRRYVADDMSKFSSEGKEVNRRSLKRSDSFKKIFSGVLLHFKDRNIVSYLSEISEDKKPKAFVIDVPSPLKLALLYHSPSYIFEEILTVFDVEFGYNACYSIHQMSRPLAYYDEILPHFIEITDSFQDLLLLSGKNSSIDKLNLFKHQLDYNTRLADYYYHELHDLDEAKKYVKNANLVLYNYSASNLEKIRINSLRNLINFEISLTHDDVSNTIELPAKDNASGLANLQEGMIDGLLEKTFQQARALDIKANYYESVTVSRDAVLFAEKARSAKNIGDFSYRYEFMHYALLARTYMHLGEKSKAIFYLKKSIDKRDAFLQKGSAYKFTHLFTETELYIQCHEIKKAQECFAKLVESIAEFGDEADRMIVLSHYKLMIMLYYSTGRYMEAVKNYQIAHQFHDDNFLFGNGHPYIHYHMIPLVMSRVYLAINKLDEAKIALGIARSMLTKSFGENAAHPDVVLMCLAEGDIKKYNFRQQLYSFSFSGRESEKNLNSIVELYQKALLLQQQCLGLNTTHHVKIDILSNLAETYIIFRKIGLAKKYLNDAESLIAFHSQSNNSTFSLKCHTLRIAISKLEFDESSFKRLKSKGQGIYENLIDFGNYDREHLEINNFKMVCADLTVTPPVKRQLTKIQIAKVRDFQAIARGFNTRNKLNKVLRDALKSEIEKTSKDTSNEGRLRLLKLLNYEKDSKYMIATKDFDSKDKEQLKDKLLKISTLEYQAFFSNLKGGNIPSDISGIVISQKSKLNSAIMAVFPNPVSLETAELSDKQVEVLYNVACFYYSDTITPGDYKLNEELLESNNIDSNPIISSVVSIAKQFHPFVATINEDVKILSTLIDVCTKKYLPGTEKFNVNQTDKQGKTCLHWAVSNDALVVQGLLINAGADFYQVDEKGIPPYGHLSKPLDLSKQIKSMPFNLGISSARVWEARQIFAQLQKEYEVKEWFFYTKEFTFAENSSIRSKADVDIHIAVTWSGLTPSDNASKRRRIALHKKISEALSCTVWVLPYNKKNVADEIPLKFLFERGQQQSKLKEYIEVLIDEYKLSLLPLSESGKLQQLMLKTFSRAAENTDEHQYFVGLIKLGDKYFDVIGSEDINCSDNVFSLLSEKNQKLLRFSQYCSLFYLTRHSHSTLCHELLMSLLKLVETKVIILDLNQVDCYGCSPIDILMNQRQFDGKTGQVVRNNGLLIAALLNQGGHTFSKYSSNRVRAHRTYSPVGDSILRKTSFPTSSVTPVGTIPLNLSRTQEIVLVVGASRGIGFGFVKYYLSQGCIVLATCRNYNVDSNLALLKKENPQNLVIHSNVDITYKKDIEVLSRKIDRVDLLILNAGIKGYSRPGTKTRDITEENLQKAFDVNTKGHDSIMLKFFKRLLHPNAAAVYISSGVSSISDNISGNYHPYRVSKAAGNQMIRGWGLALIEQFQSWNSMNLLLKD